MERCPWAGNEGFYTAYHDDEWGCPLHDEKKHFEMLLLETQQAGLSWRTILSKRDSFRAAYAGFDPSAVARFGDSDVKRLLVDAGIIRNRRKIEGAIRNARAFLEIASKFGSFDSWIWKFVDGKPIVNSWREQQDVPVTSSLSDSVSKEFKSRGFSFIGSTTVYSYLQAIGLVNDHLVSCFRWTELRSLGLA